MTKVKVFQGVAIFLAAHTHKISTAKQSASIKKNAWKVLAQSQNTAARFACLRLQTHFQSGWLVSLFIQGKTLASSYYALPVDKHVIVQYIEPGSRVTLADRTLYTASHRSELRF